MYKDDALFLIKKSFNENNNSHVFLIVTNNKERAVSDIKKLLIDVLDNLNEESRSQIIDEKYIEMIVTRNESIDIKKEQIQAVMEKIKSKPVISNYMVNVIVDADKMNDYSSNMLLKSLEEPEETVLHFLIANDINKVLKTIQSRCEIYNIKYDTEDSKLNETLISNINELIELIEKKDMTDYHIYINSHLDLDYKEILNSISYIYYLASINNTTNYQDAIMIIKNNNSNSRIINKAFYLNKTLTYFNLKVIDDILLDKIFIELNEVL